MLRLKRALPLLALALLVGCEGAPPVGDAPEAVAGRRAADLPQTPALLAKAAAAPHGGRKGR